MGTQAITVAQVVAIQLALEKRGVTFTDEAGRPGLQLDPHRG